MLALNSYLDWSKDFKVTQSSGSRSCHRPLIAWDKPHRDIIKINFDGSLKSNDDDQIDFIFKDNSGCPKYIHSAMINSTSALISEASALLVGLRAAVALGMKKIIAEGDNLTIINALNGSWRVPWNIRDTIEDIREELMKFDYYKISHCYREGNKAANFLASKFNDTISSICNPMLRDFLIIIRQDVLGYTFTRMIV